MHSEAKQMPYQAEYGFLYGINRSKPSTLEINDSWPDFKVNCGPDTNMSFMMVHVKAPPPASLIAAPPSSIGTREVVLGEGTDRALSGRPRTLTLWMQRGSSTSSLINTNMAQMKPHYVVNRNRGQGLAKALVSSMSRRLYSQGFPVYCFVEEENTLSYSLYTNLGFTEDPQYRAAGYQFNY
ncbi:LOW QUALITY PROTEIN: uncharacterized protein ACWYII_025761 [Salvelinus alpinus]